MQNFTQHPHWPAVQMVAQTLKQGGYQAWLAGGCVRDALLGRVANDFDIATNARPETVEKLFTRSVAVGKDFGVIVIPFDGFQIEVATFRKDGIYADGRRPVDVVFCTPQEDAERRDFTVNALFYDLETAQIMDFVGGRQDLAHKILRTVGAAQARFAEDHLRILRAARFAAQLNFKIHSDTYLALRQQGRLLAAVAHERIGQEFNKLLMAEQRVQGLQLLEFLGLRQFILPHWPSGHSEWFMAKRLLLRPPSLQAAMLLALLLEPLSFTPNLQTRDKQWLQEAQNDHLRLAQKQLAHLKQSNQTLDQAARILSTLKLCENWQQVRVGEKRQWLAALGAENLWPLLEHVFFTKGQAVAADPHLFSERELPTPFLSGANLLQLGVSPGPRMGEILREAYNLQLEGKLQQVEDACAWLKSTI